MRFGYVLLGLVTLTSTHISSGIEGFCGNGLAGVQKDDICCDLECGECGGGGCGGRPGGNENCCTGRIESSGRLCSVTEEAPCIINDQDELFPTCRNGLRGVSAKNVCCKAECNKCGGAGCANGPCGASGCCHSRITRPCLKTGLAPCIMEDE